MKKNQITLKQVGYKNESDIGTKTAKSIKNSTRYEQRRKNYFQEEVDPEQQRLFHIFQAKKQHQNSEYTTKFTLIEDPRKSSFAYRKFIVIDKIVCMLTISSLILSLIKTEIDINKADRQNELSLLVMNIITSITILLQFFVFIRYVCQFILQQHQKKIYVRKKLFSERYNLKFLSFIQQSPSVKSWVVEAILILPHPMSWVASLKFELFQSYHEVYLSHFVNDILSLIMLLRIFLIIRTYVQISIYSSPRASRLCCQNSFNHDTMYSIKCLINEAPLFNIAISYAISCLIFAIGLKLSQGMFSIQLPGIVPTAFQSYGNCLWCIFITMTTVGYGDYFPKTIPGRVVAVCAAIMGVTLGSLLIVALSNYLTMQKSQTKSHVTLTRLIQHKKLSYEASEALAEAIKLSRSLNMNNNKTELQNIFVHLKNKIDKIKMSNRHIKSIIDSDNIGQQMNRLFEITKDSLMDVFKNQIKLKKILQTMQKDQDRRLAYIKTSFDRQVGEVLKDLR